MNRSRVLRVGTRGSPLARWQAEHVCEALAAGGVTTRVVEVRTTGDLDPHTPIEQFADPALFTRQIDEAMLAGEVDLAVHSLKDLPTALPQGIVIAAVGSREDPRDALVSLGMVPFLALPVGAVVASSSLRRRAQMLRVRPDLEIIGIRGNVHSRLARVGGTEPVSGTILAVAGLLRLGLAARIAERLPLDLMLPAPGQAALAITARQDDPEGLGAAQRLFNERSAALCTTAERSLLAALEGGCEVPVGAYATLTVGPEDLLHLRARVVSCDGGQSVDGECRATCRDAADAAAVGRKLADQLLQRGAGAILDQVRAPAGRDAT